MPELSLLFEDRMKQYKSIIVIIVLTIAIGASYFFMQRQDKVSNIPTLCRRYGNTYASSEFLNAQKAVDFYREEIRKKPDAVKNYVELAQLFMQESRVTGNHHEYIPKAQRMIEEALNRDHQDIQANLVNASLLMTLHQFEQAKEIAGEIIQKNPYSATAYGVLCDAQVELGHYNE